MDVFQLTPSKTPEELTPLASTLLSANCDLEMRAHKIADMAKRVMKLGAARRRGSVDNG
ncbi:unnamed protein product [Ceratitis capitata]|uniref:(Mediterranean fruit fly) hypothetical protein n=1 Tax=Ceratitis capitata TaxID=7213 RepID=A0A811VBS4_CERCA|nr:unnamed protein product [Ceratitis capitata]